MCEQRKSTVGFVTVNPYEYTQCIDSFSFFFYFLITHHSSLKIQFFFYMFILGVILSNSTCSKPFQIKGGKIFFTGGSSKISDHHEMRDTTNELYPKQNAEQTPPLFQPQVRPCWVHTVNFSCLKGHSFSDYLLQVTGFPFRSTGKVKSPFFPRDTLLLRHKKSSPWFSRFQTLTLVLVCSVCMYVFCLDLGLD